MVESCARVDIGGFVFKNKYHCLLSFLVGCVFVKLSLQRLCFSSHLGSFVQLLVCGVFFISPLHILRCFCIVQVSAQIQPGRI